MSMSTYRSPKTSRLASLPKPTRRGWQPSGWQALSLNEAATLRMAFGGAGPETAHAARLRSHSGNSGSWSVACHLAGHD
eukprot:3504708-Pyramimonas_sp.AAC.1